MLLSVIVIAKNEEERLKRCLESVLFADEIIVLDSGSTDKTIEVARHFTNKVYQTDWQGYGVQKQRALAYANGQWVLNLDADEVVGDSLKDEILKAIHTDKADAYRVPIFMYFYNKRMRYSSSPARHIRLFKRQGARYSDDIVHEKIVLPPNARVSHLSSGLEHHSFHDLSHALYKINKYSSYTAKTRLEAHQKESMLRTLLSTAWMFFRCYVLQRGIFDGKEGFVLALLNAQGTLFRGLKQCYPDIQLDKLPSTKTNRQTEISASSPQF